MFENGTGILAIFLLIIGLLIFIVSILTLILNINKIKSKEKYKKIVIIFSILGILFGFYTIMSLGPIFVIIILSYILN